MLVFAALVRTRLLHQIKSGEDHVIIAQDQDNKSENDRIRTVQWRDQILQEAREFQKMLSFWTTEHSHNFAHFDRLIAAELYRVQG